MTEALSQVPLATRMVAQAQLLAYSTPRPTSGITVGMTMWVQLNVRLVLGLKTFFYYFGWVVHYAEFQNLKFGLQAPISTPIRMGTR